jgi:hypothetical protein
MTFTTPSSRQASAPHRIHCDPTQPHTDAGTTYRWQEQTAVPERQAGMTKTPAAAFSTARRSAAFRSLNTDRTQKAFRRRARLVLDPGLRDERLGPNRGILHRCRRHPWFSRHSRAPGWSTSAHSHVNSARPPGRGQRPGAGHQRSGMLGSCYNRHAVHADTTKKPQAGSRSLYWVVEPGRFCAQPAC